MTQNSINEAAQKKRRSDAIYSACFSSVLILAFGLGLLFLRTYHAISGFWGTVLLIWALADLGAIIPIWILLKRRLEEIEGGEEDAATQY